MTDEILSMGTGAQYGGQIMLTPESIVWPSKTGKETGMLFTGKVYPAVAVMAVDMATRFKKI